MEAHAASGVVGVVLGAGQSAMKSDAETLPFVPRSTSRANFWKRRARPQCACERLGATNPRLRGSTAFRPRRQILGKEVG